MVITANYIDRAYSARTDRRPEFRRMLSDSKKGGFDVVLVYKIDRFARNKNDAAVHRNALTKNRVKLISATEVISSGPEGIILESMLDGMAEYYSANLSQNIRRGQDTNAQNGKNNGGRPLLGYKKGEDNTLIIDPKTSPIVLDIFTQYDSGEKMVSIMASLNNRGLLTRERKTFTRTSFTHILSNRKYLGEYKYRDVVIPNSFPDIVPIDLFNRVQERLKKKSTVLHVQKQRTNIYYQENCFAENVRVICLEKVEQAIQGEFIIIINAKVQSAI